MPRLALRVDGIVQGVGFRPFVYRRASALGLGGWVRNGPGGVEIEVQGPERSLHAFIAGLTREPSAPARVERIEIERRAEEDAGPFQILASEAGSGARPSVPADLAVCEECAREVDSETGRRRGYPFTSCAQCGPRYTILSGIPYDRARTTMDRFPMCPACAAEYADPSDRRFHAEPIACPACGPRVQLVAAAGDPLEPGIRGSGSPDGALREAAAAVLAGKVVAVKGLSGFHLLVDATSPDAVALLRRRKRRDAKPFAVMFGSLDAVRGACRVSPAEADALRGPEAPIVLLRRLSPAAARVAVADAVAPGTPRLGALLPYTPLHRLVLQLVGRPVVCTSGNLSDEPICTDTSDALERLSGIADLFLVHDRPIVRPLDDSVARVGPAGVELLRRARGFTPLPLPLRVDAPPILALGGHLKSTTALFFDGQVVVSQHLGDAHTAEGAALIERTALDLARLFRVRPERVACDLHPDYASSRIAEQLAAAFRAPLVRVQHHHAHVAACVAEHGLDGPVLGLAWDGAGYGLDGALWGGEALVVDGASFRRTAHLRSFPLPGGERAMREPRRSALGLLWELRGEGARDHARSWFREAELGPLLSMLARGTSSPRTTSVGRLFDGVAALAGLRGAASFEGQAAMELECLAEAAGAQAGYPLPLRAGAPGVPAVLDFGPLIDAVLDDRRDGVPPGVIAARFHAALADVAEALAAASGLGRIVLAGGCFQNALLAASIRERLAARGVEVYAPRLYPPGDGGLSLGQVLVAARRGADAESDVESDVESHAESHAMER
ncbi:carbamoyltransferase HypF [Sorangium atrum]|uniref:Carbamoyltransferase n=1 Tax=Sorangium atrum TaxID=2995308 RepID=A0ABT5CG75_9BACT|nr:carbamoyltransferase HypF [Sorangium aterium]MDC0685438.1 carbamoyltransferase HypF [Sorangium aterium]